MEFTEKELTIHNEDGEPISILNANFAKKQNINKDQLGRLKKLHMELHNLFLEMTKKREVTNEEALEYSKEVERLEFEMQDNWNFERNANMHSNWFKDPNCSCPYYDNIDALGTDLRYHGGGCKIHDRLISQ